MLGRAPHRDRERLDLDRLRDEVVGAGANRTDRGLEAAERGQHEHRHIGSRRDDLLTQLEAGHALHVEIGDDDIDVLLGQLRERIGTTAERHRGEPALLEPELDELDHLALVVDDEHLDRTFGAHAAPPFRGK